LTLRAHAFHEAISAEKLEELFKSDQNVLFAGSTAGECSLCKKRFAIFFPAKDDPENLAYLAKVNEMIAKDCRGGRHRGEYAFCSTP
jgi:hypothetical protein